jgi:predicted RNase H-like nuclease
MSRAYTSTRTRVVLGIDAAWTAARPSGVALVRGRGDVWQCLAVAPSYASFLASSVDWTARPQPGVPDCDGLIAAAVRIAGAPPDVIAIDMPLSTRPITSRRVADNAISSAFGARGLGAHSPSAVRPGPIADAMRDGFAALGYSLACASTPVGTRRVMIEVFPHAAAIELVAARYRVPYKLSRIAQYWPDRSPGERRRALLAQWTKLRRALASRVSGGALRIPRAGALAELKRYEDAMDALICAWVGIEYLASRARPHGDETAAVWTTNAPGNGVSCGSRGKP